MAGTEGAVLSGTYGLGDIPAALLKYDKDKDYAGIIIYIQREIASLTYLIRERLPKVQVSSHEPTLAEVTERTYKFYCVSAAAPGSAVMNEVWVFADADAKNFQRNDFFIVDGVYFNGTATWTTTFSATSGPKEQVRVVDVGAAGSGGSTNTNVTIQRGWGGTGAGTPSQVTSAMALVLNTSTSGEGSRSRQSVGKNLATESNYLQLFREPYEATDFEMDEDTFYNERPEQVNANLASLLLMKKLEFSMWQNRKAKVTDTASGKLMYTFGGVIEYVPKDSDHQINFAGPITPPSMNDCLKDILKLGGSTEKFLYCGYSFAVALSNAYDQKIQVNQSMSMRYGIRIQTLESSVGGLIHIIPSFALTELGYDWEAFVLDFGNAQTPYFQYMYMDDLYINAGPQGKGIQNNDEFIRKEEFVGKIGLIRRASQYHAHIYGITH
jgi:hypothetical protein